MLILFDAGPAKINVLTVVNLSHHVTSIRKKFV